MAAIWSALLAFLAAALGALRLPMPAVFPESNSKVKLGPPDAFRPGSETHLPEQKLWVVHDGEGLYAISTVCTHLGCIAGREKTGEFRCPCHGSVFNPQGKVVGGPAPKALNRLALSLAPDGQVVVDTMATVDPTTRLKV
ncbi:MAG: ubiquinol-cytochrome c reductase iron-sulfur subunit [Candidatus Wallbacteria bacterium]|nr:ubiquinol-cytochrome c reductase iron-sulfur subunit [Candidatus Wallbacteria bacterium]